MNTLIIFSSILAVAFARPGYLLSHHVATLTAPLTIAKLSPGAPTGLDGRVVDTPEVALAKAEHAVAHINERITLANEAVKSTGHVIAYSTPFLTTGLNQYTISNLVPSAPVGPDGRVVDTPEVAIAKAKHATAHLNEKINLVSEASKPSYEVPVLVSAYSSPVIHKYLI